MSMRRLVLQTVAVLFLTGSSCFAATYSWAGANDADWAVSTNWSPNGVPGAGDTANISTVNSGPGVQSGNVTVAAVNISNGADLIIHSGFSLTCTNASVNAINSVSGAGTWNVSGTFTSDNLNNTSNSISPPLNLTGSIVVNTGWLSLSNPTINGNVTATNAGTKVLFGNTIYLGGNLTGTMDGEGTITLQSNLNVPSGTNWISDNPFSFTFSGTGTFTVQSGGSITYSGGVFNCPLVVQAGGSISVPGSNNNFNGNVTLNGNLSAGNAQLAIGNGATFTINNTATWSNGTSFTGQGTLAIGASASVQASTSGPDNVISCSGFTNSGTITLTSGHLVIQAGSNSGTIDASAGGTLLDIPVVRSLTNASGGILKGTVGVSGTLTFAAPLNFTGNLSLSDGSFNGTVNGPGPLTITNGSSFTMPSGGGNINVAMTLVSGASLTIAGPGNIGGTVTANGPVIFSSAGSVGLTGSLTCNSSVNVTSSNLTGSGTFSIGSSGTLNSNNGSGTNNFSVSNFLNAGTVVSQVGTLNVGSNYTQSAGTTQFNGGNLTGTLNLNGGVLTGSGTLTGSVVNSAAVTPATSGTAGAITITGNYTQNASGVLNVDIGGTTPGTQFDQLAVGGSVTLNGTLNVALINSFSPVPANNFSIITSASESGAFSIVSNGATGVNPTYSATITALSQANNPKPSITALNPGVAVPGGASFTLTITGANFVASSSVLWSGQSNLTPTNVTAGTITVTVPASYNATAGSATVKVSNPGPGGGTSNGVTFNINASNPVPSLTTVAPNSATVGGASFNLTVSGTSFITTSVVNFNGVPKATTFVSPTQLTAAINAADISTVGNVNVTVTTPQPGGGTTSAQTFTISAPTGGGATGTVGGGFGPPQPPFLASGPFATPNPAVAGQAVTLVAAAGDANGDGLAYTWNFGDGSTGTGSAVSHTYAAAGVYTAIVSVSDGTSVVSGSVDVAVNATAGSGTLNIQKASIKFAFNGANKDSLTFTGTLTGPTSAKTVTLQMGSFKKTFSATDKTSKFSLKNGKVGISLKNASLFNDLKGFGFVNTAVNKPGIIVTVDVVLTVDGVSFVQSIDFSYTSKAGSSGTAVK